MKKIALLLFVLLISISAFTQKMKFRKITEDMLQETSHPSDTQANAAILYNSCRVYYVLNNGWFDLHTYVHKRIKIYNQLGMAYGDFAIDYHGEGNFVKFKAYTYNLEGGKVLETKLDNDNYHMEEFNKIYKRRKFAMPALAPGSVIDIEYELSEPSTISLRPFFMQYDIPVNQIEYEVEVPEYFRFNKTMKGLPIKVIRESESKTGILPGSVANNNYTISVDIYKAFNVPALKEEPFVPTMDNYRSSVSYELSFFQGPSMKVTNFSTNWDDIAEKYMNAEYFGKQLDAKLSDLAPVVEKALTLPEEERYKYLYNYVRNNYIWNEGYGEYCEKGLKKMVDGKTGNVADMNLLLINLLKKAGLNASPVVICTRDKGFLNISFPSYSQINYVFATVKQAGELVFLDATTPSLDAGYLPERALNLDGILITPDGKGIRIEITNPNKGTVQNVVLAEITPEFEIKGQARTTYINYDACKMRSSFRNAEKEGGFDKAMSENYPNMEIISQTVTGADSMQAKVVHTFEFVMEGQVGEAGDLLYVNPMLIWQDLNNQFKSEKREFPVFYTNTGTEKHMISIKFPDGYQVESLPKAVRLALPDGLGTFSYSIAVNGNVISIQYLKVQSADIIAPAHYEALRSLITLMIDKQAEKVVLKKI